MKVNILKTMSAHSSAGTRAMLRDWLRWLLVLTALAAGLHYAMFARSVLAAPSETPKHSAKSAKPKPFASAEEATAAFAAAVQAGDKASLRAILGSNGAALLIRPIPRMQETRASVSPKHMRKATSWKRAASPSRRCGSSWEKTTGPFPSR